MPFNDRKRFDAEMHAVLLNTSAPNALDDMSCQCAQHKTSVVHSTKTKRGRLCSANETNYGQLTASLSIRRMDWPEWCGDEWETENTCNIAWSAQTIQNEKQSRQENSLFMWRKWRICICDDAFRVGKMGNYGEQQLSGWPRNSW